MAFESNKDYGILRPENFFGVVKFEQKYGEGVRERSPFDGTHGFGDKLWTDKMVDGFQDILDPDGQYKLGTNARYNGSLVAVREVDAGVLGTTAHGSHGTAVDEILWRSEPNLNSRSFAQTISVELTDAIVELNLQLEAGEINLCAVPQLSSIRFIRSLLL